MISTGELVPVLFQIQTRVTTEVGEGDTVRSTLSRGVQPFGLSGPHWKKSYPGPHTKYIETRNHKKIYHNVLRKFMILCWAALGASWAACGLRAAGWTPLLHCLHLGNWPGFWKRSDSKSVKSSKTMHLWLETLVESVSDHLGNA